MTAYSDNDRVKILKGTAAGKPGTITSLNVTPDGLTSRKLDFASVEPLVVAPPPAPTVEFVSATGGVGVVDYEVRLTGAADHVLIGLDPGATLPKQSQPWGTSAKGRLANVPAGTYSVWAAAVDAAGKDLAIAKPLSVTVAPVVLPPPSGPVPGELMRAYSFENTDNPFPVLEQPKPGTELRRVAAGGGIPDPPGDAKYWGRFRHFAPSERVEGTDYGYTFYSGAEFWTGVSYFFPDTLKGKLPAGQHHSINQQKQGPNTNGGPAQELDLRVDQGFNFYMAGKSYHISDFDPAIGKIWNLQWRVKLHKTAGNAELWINDQKANFAPVGDSLGGGPDYVYLKFGSYGLYNCSVADPADILQANIRIGTTRAIVRPPGT